MGKITGFAEYKREEPQTKSVADRIKNYQEFYLPFDDEKLKRQAARCMDCGVPFCHRACPLANIIPEFNDQMYRGNTEGAYRMLNSTNTFPEFTGRVCPAPCENSCISGSNGDAVTIKLIEKYVAEKAFEQGFVKPQIPTVRTNKRIAVIGSGPAGLAAANQLNKAGHRVVVFERDDKIGGLLRYGIPDFKLDKSVIDRRLAIMKEEGIAFKTNAEAGGNISFEFLLTEFDAVLLCTGAGIPRTLDVPGINNENILQAMPYLTAQNRIVAGIAAEDDHKLSAKGKNVVVIGGGDTGADCVGTAIRQGACSVTQIEIMPKPPLQRAADNPWPQYARILRTSSSHVEGCNRLWSVLIKEFRTDTTGKLMAVKIVDIDWKTSAEGKKYFIEISETEREIACDMVLSAIGFAHTEHKAAYKNLGLKFDACGNIQCENYRTSIDKIFAAGDMRRGQSLVVHAISEGMEAARVIDIYLTGRSQLRSKNKSLVCG